MQAKQSSTPNTILGPEETLKYKEAQENLFLYVYKKRETYFKRWRKVTLRYFDAVEKNSTEGKEKQTKAIEEAIQKYSDRIKERKEKFLTKFPFTITDANNGIVFLEGMDILVFPESRDERRSLIEKEEDYHKRNESINQTTGKSTSSNLLSELQDKSAPGEISGNDIEDDKFSYEFP